MMYNNKLVAVIKVDGKILRERGETVYIPFGSEYEINLKNLHTTDAVVDITIDGEDVLDGHSLIVRKGGESKLEGFLRGNDVSHKFKFIEKTQEISDYRGDKISDGLIVITFKFEKERWPTFLYNQMRSSSGPVYPKGDMRSISYSSDDNTVYMATMSAPMASSVPPNDDGITVKGSSSDQSFQNSTVGQLEDIEHTIVFQLKGETSTGYVVEQPVTVKTKVKCDTCGRTSNLKGKFCSNCGTSLVI